LNSRLDAVLSLYRIAASISSRSDMLSCCSVTGELGWRSPREYVMRRSRSAGSVLASSAAACSALNVEQYANRSSARCSTVRPDPVSTANTPSRASKRASKPLKSAGATAVVGLGVSLTGGGAV
jgi:hypothetical protein